MKHFEAYTDQYMKLRLNLGGRSNGWKSKNSVTVRNPDAILEESEQFFMSIEDSWVDYDDGQITSKRSDRASFSLNKEQALELAEMLLRFANK